MRRQKNKINVNYVQAIKTYSKQNLALFTSYCFDKGYDIKGEPIKYIHGHFSRQLCQDLEQFFNDLQEGKKPHLIISAPPRHGKTELSTKNFPAWAFGRDPNLNIISVSYSQTLASSMALGVQQIMKSSHYNQIFNHIKLGNKAKDKATKNTQTDFTIGTHSGSYFATGVSGGITGKGADILIIDDPVKNWEDCSKHKLNKTYDWFTSTAYTRLSPKGGCIIIMTRWSEDDLVGRLLNEARNNPDAQQWKVVKYEAIASKDESFRRKGEALQAERYDLTYLNKLRQQLGALQFSALYQQDPRPVDGELMNRREFTQVTLDDIKHIKFNKLGIFCDTAQKTGKANDYSVLLLAGVVYVNNLPYIYILDIVRAKLTAPQLEASLINFHAKNEMLYNTKIQIYIEDKSSGIGLVQTLQRKNHLKVHPVAVHSDKFTRFSGVQSLITLGQVLTLSGSWNSAFFLECESFTSSNLHKHDDQVDAMVMALTEFNYKKTTSAQLLLNRY